MVSNELPTKTMKRRQDLFMLLCTKTKTLTGHMSQLQPGPVHVAGLDRIQNLADHVCKAVRLFLNDLQKKEFEGRRKMQKEV